MEALALGGSGPRGEKRGLAKAWDTVKTEWQALRILRASGVFPPIQVVPGVLLELARSGVAGGGAVLGRLHGDRVALVDPEGSLTYRELGRQCSAAVNGLRGLVPRGDKPVIAMLTRNSRYALIGLLGSAGIGARVVMMNTDMGAKQLAEVCAREKVRLVIHDENFADRLAALDPQIAKLVAARSTRERRDDTLGSLIARASTRAPRPPRGLPEVVILTSGSTGAPKGSQRGAGSGGGHRPSLAAGAGVFSKLPFRSTDSVFLAPPLFHGWGALVLGLALGLGAKLVLEPGFNAKRSVELIGEHRCTAIILVPTMIQRLLALGHDGLAAIDHSSVRMIGSGGARLDPSSVEGIRQEFGPVLYNLYGATEAAFISIATPSDLVADPECAGSPSIGVTVKVFQNDKEVPAGMVGDIYVGSALVSPQYTDGRRKEMIGDLLKTGDTGYFNEFGRLFVVGRSDGMIVSGGENVFPEEVELALLGHPQVKDAKVVPVPDDDFGQRLRAFIVPSAADSISAEDVKAFVSTELSRSRVPRDVLFVDDLPRTAMGKVTKSALDELASAVAGSGATTGKSGADSAGATTKEAR
ncbi:MAG: AMP-binding protein [Segniliparus sp.]|uniref:AMP-binding protein n=1 Tax=Segniliparus sp. TaxID=2804064 RepID=UPI003F2B9BFF